MLMQQNICKTRAGHRARSRLASVLTVLALLLTAATGAWAQTSDKETPLTLQATADGTITIYNPKDGMKYKVGDGEKQTVTGTDNVYINVNEGQTVQFFGNGTSITAYGVEQGFDTKFDSSVPCCIYGNIMSLVNETGFATATDLTGDYAFKLLFSSFRNLSNHSSRKLVLPATTLTKNCYYSMFAGCTGLTTAPALPATELAEQCYYSMFYGCSSLTAAPELPATTLKKKCYYGMFQNCTSLTTAPALPATELAQQCYNWMFYGCTNLTTAPLLPAPTLAPYCYTSMFSGCTKLNAVTCLATNISAEYATLNWLKDVAETGTLTIAKGMENKWTANSAGGIPSGWSTDVYGYKVKLADRTADAGNWTATVGTSTTAEPLPVGGLSNGDAVTLTYSGRLKVKSVTATTDAEPDPLATPLTIEAVTDGTIVVNIDGTLTTGMKYSVNGDTPTLITTTTDITVAKDDNVQFYGNGTQTQCYGGDPEVKILGSGDGFKTKVYGNIMSLLDEEGFATKTDLSNASSVFSGLFRGNATLIDASELLLPAETLTTGCYFAMFKDCTSLTKAPKLPATTLTDACYYNMFKGCTSLTSAPKLPATTLATSCYQEMFVDCTSLTSAYVKAAFTGENYMCSDMFDGCTADGAVLHTTSDNKASWEDKMGPNKEWPTWTVADDWQD